MSNRRDLRHDLRQMAMQALYQFDMASDEDLDLVRQSLVQEGRSPDASAAAIDLAAAAWSDHEAADRLSSDLAPGWPVHRQPPVDRAILRLAYHELTAGRAPYKVVINEAVELAKTFSSDRSPSFVNGVLDKMARQLGVQGERSGGG